MKSVYKIKLVLVLVMLMSSCASDNKTLTETHVLEHLKQCEAKRPNIKWYTITKSNYNVPVNFDTTIDNPGTREYKHLMQLVTDGYIKSDLISASSTGKNYDSYKFSVLPKAEPFVLKEKRPNTMRFIMYETKTVSVENIEIIDAIKANVTLKYTKVKTPFYITDYDVSTNQNIPVKPDTYTETIVFRKSNTNGWKYCNL